MWLTAALHCTAAGFSASRLQPLCTTTPIRAWSARPLRSLAVSLRHHHAPLQASLKADQAKLSDLQQQEAQVEQSAEQVTQQVEELAAKMDDLKKQVGVVHPA